MTEENETKSNWFDLQFHDGNRERIRKPDQISLPAPIDPLRLSLDPKVLDRIKGSLFGLAIGDALGAHVEFRPQSYLAANPVTDLQAGGTWGLEKGQFTDDTSMALCLSNSLIACDEFVPYDQLVRYKWWYRYGYMSSTGHCFDIGTATRQSIQEFEQRQTAKAVQLKIPVEEMDRLMNDERIKDFNVQCSNEGVAGNGALMRLAPVPLFFYEVPNKAVRFSGESGQITHGDQKAIDACRYYGALIVAALRGEAKEKLLSGQFYKEHHSWFDGIPLHKDIMDIALGSFKKAGGYADGIQGKGYVVKALEAALWAFWSDDNSFETGALAAVNLGDDTDTTAAIYGQLAGAYYGFAQLPSRWRDVLYAEKFITHVCHSLASQGKQWHERVNNKSAAVTSLTNSKSGSIKDQNYPSVGKLSLVGGSSNIIERKALDPNGSIGCLYNACTDSIEQSTSNHNDLIREKQDAPSSKCLIKRGNELKFANLLEFLGFDLELRLSLFSGIVSPRGIASVIEYPYLFDEDTRLLYYSTISKRTELNEEVWKESERLSKASPCTHLIREIHSGIDLLILLRISKRNAELTDEKLRSLTQSFLTATQFDESDPFDSILSLHVYSNIPILTEQKTIRDVYRSIRDIQRRSDMYWPLNYILHPIGRYRSSNGTREENVCFAIQSRMGSTIEKHLGRFLLGKKYWKTMIDRSTAELLEKHLHEQLREQKNVLQTLDEQHEREKKQIERLILAIRQNKSRDEINAEEVFSKVNEDKLKYAIDDLIYQLNSFKAKVDFIEQLDRRGLEYSSASKYRIEQNDDLQSIERKVCRDQCQRSICSSDFLNEFHFDKLNRLIEQMKSEENEHKLVYIDFSYSPCNLAQPQIFPSNHSSAIDERIETPRIDPTKAKPSTQSVSSEDRTKNILLVGKSGVGKSTLVNTFGEYILSRRDHVIGASILIPIVHLIDNEHEGHFVRFGPHDSNEDHDHPGQSLTQQCKSYRFKFTNEQTIRLIDTPGFGDRRGQQYDQTIMQDISSYVKNLTHLNAICLVIDGHDTQLEEYRQCLKQLFHLLDESIRDRLLVCLTKTLDVDRNVIERTNAAVQSMLQSMMSKPVSLSKVHVYQFDSSYFIQSATRHFMFTLKLPNARYAESLLMTKNAWTDLINYVTTDLSNYSIFHGLQTRENTRAEIQSIVRPICEAMRNLVRNDILYRYKFERSSIEWHPKPIGRDYLICYSCHRYVQQCGMFWIISESSHHHSDVCRTCSCTAHEHVRSSYRLDYTFSDHRPIYQPNEMSHFLGTLLSASARLSSYLHHTNERSNRDLFLAYLDRMIDDESAILKKVPQNNFNLRLYKKLGDYRHVYKQQFDSIIRRGQYDDLPSIQHLLSRVKQYPCISEQLTVHMQGLETFL